MSSMFHKGIVYDAFLSYHESDREWVTEDLLKILEDNGLSVCWDIRDFEPGKTVIENKLHALCSSACTLVVLTPNYVTSEALWNILNEECGIDKKEIYTQFNLVPILLVQCRVPDVFVPLWKIDLTNNAVKMFFGKKLVQTVKKFVDGNYSFIPLPFAPISINQAISNTCPNYSVNSIQQMHHSFQKMCNLWNTLPSCFPESYNLLSFKSKISRHDLISLSS